MCGIFGWSWKKRCKVPLGQRQAFASTLAIANSFRGADSWGAFISNRSEFRIEKGKGDVCEVPTAQWGLMPVVMGHTRFATVGAKTKENSHPFTVDNIILAHNGSVFNYKELNEKYPDRKCEVDSPHLAYAMAGKMPWKEIHAYGAMEWAEGPGSIFLCKLSYNADLSVCKIMQAGEQVGTAWSSTKWHLIDSIKAARLSEIMYEEPKKGKVVEVANGILFETKRPNIEVGETTRSFQYTGGTTHSPHGYWDNGTQKWIDIPRTGSEVNEFEGGMMYSRGRHGGAVYQSRKSLPATTEPTKVDVADEYKHEFLGLTKMDDGVWVNARGEIIPLDSIQADEAEEAECIRWMQKNSEVEVTASTTPEVVVTQQQKAE